MCIGWLSILSVGLLKKLFPFALNILNKQPILEVYFAMNQQ